MYYSILRSNINSIRVWLNDQDGIPIILRGKMQTIKVMVRDVYTESDIIKAAKELKRQNII